MGLRDYWVRVGGVWGCRSMMLGLGPGFRGISLRYLTGKLLKVLCRDCAEGIKGYAVMYGFFFARLTVSLM